MQLYVFNLFAFINNKSTQFAREDSIAVPTAHALETERANAMLGLLEPIAHHVPQTIMDTHNAIVCIFFLISILTYTLLFRLHKGIELHHPWHLCWLWDMSVRCRVHWNQLFIV